MSWLPGTSALRHGQAVEQLQAAIEVVRGADVAGQDQQVRRLFGEPGGQLEGGPMSGSVPSAEMQVGRDRDP